ncbi:CCCH zinc finger and RRM domain-containing protein [Histoplasma capsulatum G186AR]|uniref:CCCH zinc finger and RRM domain-containing protein n=2 Tax=Ajellomyces capsulatus TaxID=5037 RepID=C0NSN3_AJECG|nr:CCCH zinc finger and RRM domain-containing protein [Histoplasma capsulatum G186AR]EEH05899.1 CCCH zinc finger and RRM domain-containing protein [Histoplasma capsulatum G186AR]
MQFTEEQAAEVKAWVVKRLEDISDADSDVLADYVLALIRSDAPDEDIRKASVENLEDFLKENTIAFVDEIFTKFNPKPQLVQAQVQPTTHQQPPESAVVTAVAPPQEQTIPSDTMSRAPFGHGQTNVRPNPLATGGFESTGRSSFSRKRAFNEGPQAGDDHDLHYNRADRPFKSMRGRRGGRGDSRVLVNNNNNHNNNISNGRMGPAHLNHQQQQQQQPQQPAGGGFQGMAPVATSAGFPPFNPSDPIAAMMTLQAAMGFPQIPGMPPLPHLPASTGTPGSSQPSASTSPAPGSIPQRCVDYDTQGFCVLGKYDPTKSNLVLDRPLGGTNGHSLAGASRAGDKGGRGRSRGRGDRGGFTGPRRNRAEFSQAGPNEDRSITTIVVEQIPEDKFDEAIVREFFSEFGNIVEVTMQPYKHLALVKYDSWAAARRAWASPKVIFDNRFVKVYWYKPGSKSETNGAGDHHHPDKSDEKPFDSQEFEKQQAEAQRQHEEKMKKRKETEEARLALEKQKEDLLKRQQEEKARLLQRLGSQQPHEADGTNGTSPAAADSDTIRASSSSSHPDENVSEQTKMLRAQLAALEAEAKSLGLDPALSDPQYPPRGRGRGWAGYRGGRGAFAARGRGFDPAFRGGGTYRGRGGVPRGRGGVLRLDNRPRCVAVSGVEFNAEKDEALRQFLLGVGEYESIEPNPDQPDSQIVSFKDRYVAEKLMYGPTDIPSVGKVEFSWVANNSSSASGTRDNSVSAPPLLQHQGYAAKKGDEIVHIGDNGTSHETDSMMLRKDAGGQHEVDYDVAEMDDAWA